MPYRKSIFARGQYYHLFNRGINKQKIFFSTENYLYFLGLLRKNSRRFQISIIAYCLMPNHYHFLVRQDGEKSISLFMRSMINSYAQGINKQYNRTGALFENRFKDKLVDKNEYVIHLSRYIHLNPVRAGLVNKPEGWEFSNYLEWIGKRGGILKDEEFITSYFPNPGDYEQFVMEHLSETKVDRILQRYLLK